MKNEPRNFSVWMRRRQIHELRDKVGEIIIAYRNARDHLSETEVPAPLTDATYLQEFQSRLGERWLGESTDREQAAKRLHTNPGFFTSVFALVAIFGILAIAVGIGLFGLLGPILNFLSLQRMLLDLQDGNYSSLVSRALSYLGLIRYWISATPRNPRQAQCLQRKAGFSPPKPAITGASSERHVYCINSLAIPAQNRPSYAVAAP